MTTPAGCISLALEHMRQTLARSATWQAEVGVSTPEDAIGRIHLHSLPLPATGGEYSVDELNNRRPYAVLWTTMGSGYSTTAIAHDRPKTWDDAGMVECRIEWTIPDNIWEQPAEIGLRFENFIGGVIDDVAALAGESGLLDIGRISYAGIEVVDDDDQYTHGRFAMTVLRFQYGGGPGGTG